jgi:hypothetical protein
MQRIRSKKLLNIKIFNNIVVQLVITIKAIHLEVKNTTFLGAPTVLFNAIKVN